MKAYFFALIIYLLPWLSNAQNSRGVVEETYTEPTKNGNTYAMVIGISDYPDLQPLQFADKDALLFYDFLRSPAGGEVPAQNIKLLLNEEATAGGIMTRGISWIQNIVKPLAGDRVYFYFAGHGDAVDASEAYLLAYDANPGGDKNNYSVSGTINIQILKNRIRKLTQSGVEVVFIVDACRTADIPGGAEGLKGNYQSIMEDPSGDIMLLSASPNEVSLEDKSVGQGHGLFTWELINGLAGAADEDGDQKISLFEIESYVKSKVRASSKKLGRLQNPVVCCSHQTETILSQSNPAWLASIQNELPKGADDFALRLASARGGNDLFSFPNDEVKTAYFQIKKYCAMHSEVGYEVADSLYNLVAAKHNPKDIQFLAEYYAGELMDACQRALNNEITPNEEVKQFNECNYYQIHQNYLQKAQSILPELGLNGEFNFRLSLFQALCLFDAGTHLEYGTDNLGPYIQYKKNGQTNLDRTDQVFQDLKKNIQTNAPKEIPSAVANFIISRLFSIGGNFNHNYSDTAIFFAMAAQKIAPKWIEPYYTLVNVNGDPLKDSLGLYYLDELEKISSLNDDNFYFIAESYKWKKQHQKAIHYYLKAIVADNYYNNWYTNAYLSILYSKINKLDSTIFYLERSLVDSFYYFHRDEFPHQFLFESRQGNKVIESLLKQHPHKRHSPEIIAFAQLICLSENVNPLWVQKVKATAGTFSNDKYISYLFNLSWFIKTYISPNKAETPLIEALGLDSNNYNVNTSLKNLYFTLEDYSKAKKYCVKLIELDSSNARHFIALAKVEIKLKSDQKTIVPILNRALELSGNRASFIHRIGKLFEEIGEFDLSKSTINKALELGYDEATDDYQFDKIHSPYNPAAFNCK